MSSRKLHDQALVVTCKSATDPGSGVVEYVVYALRATNKGDAAPADNAANFSIATEIGRLSNLDQIVSYRSGTDPQIRVYDPLNEYRFGWYNWEEGYAYRVWTFAYDYAGNIEQWDGAGNTNTTSVLTDSRPPQFAAYTAPETRVPFNAFQKSSILPWSATKAGASLNFLIQADNGAYPGWNALTLDDFWLVFDSADDGSPNYTYFAVINTVTDAGGGQDQVAVYCSTTQPIYQLDNATDKIVAITAIANVVNDDPVEWAAGRVVVVNRPLMTCGIGTMTVEYEGVAPEVADLDHYRIKRYVSNTRIPTQPGAFKYIDIINIEDTKFTDYNLVWTSAWLKKWTTGDTFTDASEIFSDALYLILPVDIYGNEGYPVITFDFVNITGFFPATGTPPSNLASIDSTPDDDGNILLEWDDVADDDLKGYQANRRRGELIQDDGGSGTGTTNTLTDGSKGWTPDEHIGRKLYDAENTEFAITDNDATTLTVAGTPSTGYYRIYEDHAVAASYTWGAWEIIIEDDYGNLVSAGAKDREFDDRGLEPFSTRQRPDKIAYQYRIRAIDYSGNTSGLWVGHSTTVVKAVDTTVNLTGVSLNATGGLGAITLTIGQPTDNKSVKVHIYRSLWNNTSYETDPFAVVELPPDGGPLSHPDPYPPVDQEILIYYKLRFEDRWGNISDFGSVENSDTSQIPIEVGSELDVEPPDDEDPPNDNFRRLRREELFDNIDRARGGSDPSYIDPQGRFYILDGTKYMGSWGGN